MEPASTIAGIDILWVGYAAAACTMSAFIPQVVKSYRLKETRDLSMPMLLITVVGLALWLAYGLLRNDPVLILSNTVSFFVTGALVALKVRYG